MALLTIWICFFMLAYSHGADVCETGGDLDGLDEHAGDVLSGLWLNIFVEHTFPCTGYLKKVEFTAYNTGKFYLSSWRGDQYGQMWTLQNYVEITASKNGTNVVELDKEIKMVKNEVLGVFFDEDGPKRVLGYHQSNNVNKHHLSLIINKPIYTSSILKDQFVVDNVSPVRRDPTLKVYIENTNDEDEAPKFSLFTNSEPALNELPKGIVSETSNTCSVGGKLYGSSQPPGNWLNIFTELTFPCSGKLEKIEFHAWDTGIFYLSSWKTNSNKDTWTLESYTQVNVTKIGRQVEKLVTTMTVSEGSSVGIFYDTCPWKRIIGYHQNSNWLNRKYSLIVNTADKAEDILDDKVIYASAIAYRRHPALQVYVNFESHSIAMEDIGISPLDIDEEDIIAEYLPDLVNVDDTVAAKIVEELEELQDDLRKKRSADGEMCFIGAPMSALAGQSVYSGQWLNIFNEMKFPCSGYVEKIKYNATHTGTFFLSAWQKKDGFWHLQSYSKINVLTEGIQTTWLNDDMLVSKDYSIGIFYDGKDSMGVIPYHQTSGDSCPPLYSGLINYRLFSDSLLNDRKVKSQKSHVRRHPALEVSVREFGNNSGGF